LIKPETAQESARGNTLAMQKVVGSNPIRRLSRSGACLWADEMMTVVRTCGRGPATAIALVIASLGLVAGPPAPASAGELVYKGCITGNTGVGPHGFGACAQIPSASRYGTGSGLAYPHEPVVSSDGRSLYVVSGARCGRAYCDDDAAVARFRRNPTTGALHYRGCISGATTTGPQDAEVACARIPSASPGAMNSGLSPTSLAVSADGKSLYTTSIDCGPMDECYGDDSLASFDRNSATGALSYQGCVTGDTHTGPSGSGACDGLPSASEDAYRSGFQRPGPIALSADGRTLYVASGWDGAIARFDRDPNTGAITYGGCIGGYTYLGPTGSGACALIPSASAYGEPSGLSYPHSLQLSADGKYLYVAIQSGVARFVRNSTTGVLTYKGCITGDTHFGPAGPARCRQIPSASPYGLNSGLSLESLALSVDGRSLYGASYYDGDVARFDRDASTGALTYEDCITGDTRAGPEGSGACAQVPSATRLGVRSGFTPSSVTVSPDGRTVYAATSSRGGDSIARLRRDPTTGALTYRDCITGDTRIGPSGTGACAEIPSATRDGVGSGLYGIGRVALSPDGKSIYVSSSYDSAVARFALAPQTRITDGPRRWTRSHRASFRFHSADSGATFECRLNRRRFRPCDSPRSYRHLKPGSHTFKVRATDSARTADPTPAKRRWVILDPGPWASRPG
jgi:DNA-binding beta-propeller fold protein YncE